MAQTDLAEATIAVSGKTTSSFFNSRYNVDTEVRLYILPRQSGVSFRPLEVRLDGKAPFEVSTSEGASKVPIETGQDIAVSKQREFDFSFKTPEGIRESNNASIFSIEGLEMNGKPIAVPPVTFHHYWGTDKYPIPVPPFLGVPY